MRILYHLGFLVYETHLIPLMSQRSALLHSHNFSIDVPADSR